METIHLWSSVAVAFLALIAYSFVPLYLASRRPKDYPPGPPTVPFLGHLTQLPKTKGFLKFHELGKQYGPIVGLKLGPQNLVILNDYKPVLDLYDRRSNIYSSRPLNHICNDIIFPNDVHALFIPYGEQLRKIRKAAGEVLKVSVVDKYLPLQNAESLQTCHDLIHDPKRWYDHIRRYSSAVILASVWGLRGATFDSPRVKTLYAVQNAQTAINELGATPPVDIFPILKLLPDFLSPWRVWARQIHKEYYRMLLDLVAASKENSAKPGAPDCLMARLNREQDKFGLDDEHVAYVRTTMMEAGSDTTASALLSFLLAMVKHPEVLKKCQSEVDAQCTTERSPSIEDIEHLPYVRACMNEVLRWRPVAAGGIPHASTQDDHYNGNFFPKGTIFFANTWAIHRSDEFADPDEFIPERWLDNKFGVHLQDTVKADFDGRRTSYGFGAGRRVCTGIRLAENSLMINLSKLVWAFNFTAPGPVDDSVETGYTGGFLICPKEFPLEIEVRSAERAKVIDGELRSQEPFLNTFGE